MRKTIVHIIHPTVGYRVSAHETCACNELIALCNRHLIDRSYIAFDYNYFKRNVMFFNGKLVALEPTAYLDVVNHYRGPKRKMYLSAMKQLCEEGLNARDYKIKMFVKPERQPYDRVMSKAPRAIQARTPKYNLAIGRYLHVFEEWFYELPDVGPSATRCVTKGLNSHQVALLLIEKSSWFSNPLYIAADHSKFDSTIRVEHLKHEHWIYDKCFKSGFLRRCLHKQLVNFGTSRHGIRYRISGTRMSGDFNTGLGNSLINYLVLRSFLGGLKSEILLDGDDSILIIERDDWKKLDFRHFERMGFETTFQFFDDITQVDYCQSKLVLSAHPIMCRNPCRAISHAAVCLRKYPPHQYQQWFGNVADCLYYTNPGMPIYDFYKLYGDTSVILDEDYYRKMENAERLDLVVDRMAFFRTWGIDPEQQRAIEGALRHFKPYKNIKPYTRRKHDINANRRKQQAVAESIAERFSTLCATDTEFWCQFGQRPSQAIPGWANSTGTDAAYQQAKKKTSQKRATFHDDGTTTQLGRRWVNSRRRHRGSSYYHGCTANILC